MTYEERIKKEEQKRLERIKDLKPGDRIVHSAVHLNGHLLCAVDTETSGKIPGTHDLIQLSVIPLSPNYEVSKIFQPFHALIQPKRPENVDKDLPPRMRDKFLEACTHGIDAWTCVDRFSEWFYNLRLPEKKQIVPLGHNYLNFDKPFIQEWLGGPLSYEEFFRSDARDSMITALFINDAFDQANLKIPFPKVQLLYLCNILGLEHPDPHDAHADAYMAAQVYKKLTRWYDHMGTPMRVNNEANSL